MPANQPFYKNYLPHLRALFAFSIVTNLMVLAPSFHMLQIYDRVLSSGSKPTLIFITLIAVFALVVYGVAETIRTKVSQRLAAKYTVSVADKLFARFANFPQSAMATSKYLRDYGTVRTFLSSRTIIGLFDLPFIPFFLLLLFFVHWSIFLVTLVGILVMALFSYLNGKMTEQSRTKSRDMDGEAIGFAQAAFSRGEDVRSLGLLPNFITLWGHRTASALIAAEDASDKSAVFFSLSKAFRQILQVSIMGWGAFLVLAGDMSGGKIFLASMISGKALGPIEQVIGSWEQITKSMAAYRAVEELTGPEKKLSARAMLPEPKGHLLARNLIYVPKGAAPGVRIVNNISLQLKPGEIVVVLGASGAGKSTFVRMLAGALRPTAGELLMDNAQYDQWPTEQWGRNIGYIAQEVNLFPGTIADNIARFDINSDEQEVYKAAQAAGVHDMILGLPKGYQSIVGMGEFQLSMGQKQNIALARALYSNPKVLILDEPNSHLDQYGEGMLFNALIAAKKRGAAIIVVSQRTSILKIANRTMRITNGKAEFLERAVDKRSSNFVQNTGSQKSAPAMGKMSKERQPLLNDGIENTKRSLTSGTAA